MYKTAPVLGLLLVSFPFSSAFATLDQSDIEKIRSIAIEASGRSNLELPVGTILPYAGTGAVPHGFLECNGQVLKMRKDSENEPVYSVLYSIIGDAYTPETERIAGSFRVPDLRSKVPMGAGKGVSFNDQGSKRELSDRMIGKDV